MNKKKIINDPVYGFINIPYKIIFDLIEHPYFQRLRHIQQLGLTSYVYPGALHTRFHHALGAMHLMHKAILSLKGKKIAISKAEAKAAIIAILLHDIGHGPFSHALEHSFFDHVSHEHLSVLFMEELNKVFKGRLDLALSIFRGEYHKPFLHQLVSSQLDMDRMDYLNRDSFFTGVQEGVIGFDRIISMLNVYDNLIVVEHKGIYSIEKFLIARRLMYWQVYLHPAVLSAEMMLVQILKRAKELSRNGHQLFATSALKFFLENHFNKQDFDNNPKILHQFAQLGDPDIFASIKEWQFYKNDLVLSLLAQKIVQRKLLKIEMDNEDIFREKCEALRQNAMKKYNITAEEATYLVFEYSTENSAYSYKGSQINILYKDQSIKNITQASDYRNLKELAQPVVKYYICYPKELVK